jgi:asparagine N-glycosylation enzyme membrane subunit Stt3
MASVVKMTQNMSSAYPNTASILALVGGILMILCGMLLAAVGSFILPYIDYANLQTPANVANLPGLVSGVITMVGFFGLISGIIVLASAVMIRVYPAQRKTWGVLMLVFSVLSFFGVGGFVVGAILGIVGGVMTLTWKAPIQ